MSVRATPKTPLTPRTPRTSKKHHNKYEQDSIPSQRFKIGYQKVTLDIDLEENNIVGETEITVLPLHSGLKHIKLDCRGIQVKSIIVNQRRANYTYDDFLQNQEYMNDPENPVLSDYDYDPHFDSNTDNISIHQHEMLRAKFFPLFSDQNNPVDSFSSYSTCTSELSIQIPESIKLRLQNASKISFSPIGTNRSVNNTPNTANTLSNSDKVYTPLNIKINYVVKKGKNGIQFYGGKHTNIPKHLWYCYTLNNDFGCSTSSWVPCIDNLFEKPAWDINIVVPKTVGDIGHSKIIGTKEAEKALKKLALQQLDTDASEENMNSDQSNYLGEIDARNGADDDEEMDDAEKVEDTPLVVVVPDLVSSRESPHPMDVAKKLVNFQFYNPVCAHHLGFAVGCFDKIPMVDLKPGSDDLTLNQQNPLNTSNKDVSLQFNIDANNTNKVPTLMYFHPGRKQDVINSTLFLYKALEFYSKEFSSFPFTSYTLLFIDSLCSETCSFAGMTIASSKLLYSSKQIEPIFNTTEKLAIALAEQYSGVNVLPKSLNDIWCTIGISRYMSNQFLKKLFGLNHYKFMFKKRCELLCDLDIGKRPLGNQMLRFPINCDQDLDFIKLKAPLILTILDRRITKTDKLFGLSRVIPKIFLQAMSNDLINGNNLSTAHFQRVCEKVAHHKLESFFQNWVHNSGVPTFRITQKFNKKRLFIEMTIRQMQTSSLNDNEDSTLNKDVITDERHKTFVDEANTELIAQDHFSAQAAFTGPVTVRIHEADGSPYEHILAISETLTKLDIQYNTKYRRKKKDKRDGTEEIDEKDHEKEKDSKKKDKADENKTCMLGNVLVSSEEIRNWDLKEDFSSNNDPAQDGNKTNSADDDKDEAFEWLRFDADNEWICKYSINLTDDKFESELKQDRDVEAQYESIKHFADVTRPTLAHAKILLRTLMDSRYYYGIRVEAAKALAHISSEENDHIGMRFLLKTFKHLYCYDNIITSNYNEFDPKEYLPKPNDFSNFADLFVCQAILLSLSTVKNKSGDTPIELKRILLRIFRYIDNSTNNFDDSMFYCSLIIAICNLIVVSNREIPDLNIDDLTPTSELPAAKDLKDEFIYSAIKELNRCLKMDKWSPSYENRVTKVVLQQKIRFVRKGLAKMTFIDLLRYTTLDYNDDIRLVAFEGILIIGGLRNSNILNYYFMTMKLDESPKFRYELNKCLVKCIGIAADNGIPSLMDDDEFLKSIAASENGSRNTGNRLIQIEDTSSAKISIQSRKDELARRSIKGSIDVLRRDLGMGKGLSHELWEAVHSCLVPINTRRNIFDIMMILYEPKDSFIVTTKLPSDKKILVKVKSKIVDTADPEHMSFIVSFKREAKFKIQIPTLKLKVSEDKSKKAKKESVKLDDVIPLPPTTTAKQPRKKKVAESLKLVNIHKSSTKYEVKIKLPNLILKENKNIVRHDIRLPLRYVCINLRTKEVKVSTNEDFALVYTPKLMVTLKLDKEKWNNFLGGQEQGTSVHASIAVKTEETVDIATSKIIEPLAQDNKLLDSAERDSPFGSETEGHVNAALDGDSTRIDTDAKDIEKCKTTEQETKESQSGAPVIVVKKEELTETAQENLELNNSDSDNSKQNAEPVDIADKDTEKQLEPVKSLEWQKNSQSIVGKLNRMKRSPTSVSPPPVSHSSLSRSRSRSRSKSASPGKTPKSAKRKGLGPKIKLRLK